MTEKWISLDLSDDRAVLRIDRAGGMLKPETDRAMTVLYRALASYAERSSTARTPEDQDALAREFSDAINAFERMLRL